MTARPYSQQILRLSAGGSDPDPATYCPVYGYVKPGEYATDPENYLLPDPEPQEINLLVSDELYRKICFKCTIQDGSQFTVKVYGLLGELSSTNVNSTSNYTYTIPLGEGAVNSQGFTTYRISIKPTTAGKNILTFEVVAIAGYTTSWQIIEARFNCPNMTSLNSAFASIKRLEYCGFTGAMDSLTGLVATFMNCDGLIKIDWPTSLNSVSSILSIFYGAKSKMRVVFPNLPALTSALTAFRDSSLTYIEFTGVSDLLTTLENACFNALLLRKFVFPSSVSSLSNLFQTFCYCALLTEITLPTGTMGVGSINWTNWIYGVVLMKINNSPTWPIAIQNIQGVDARFLSEFNQPTLRMVDFRIGGTAAIPSLITYLNIDWANSYSAATGLVYATFMSLDATEINRIFTALPTVTSGTANFVNNPGYATCDKTIATAKGWTVT